MNFHFHLPVVSVFQLFCFMSLKIVAVVNAQYCLKAGPDEIRLPVKKEKTQFASGEGFTIHIC